MNDTPARLGKPIESAVDGENNPIEFDLAYRLQNRPQEAVEALVLSDKYDLILPRQSVHYRHELYDVTAKITEKMNALQQ